MTEFFGCAVHAGTEADGWQLEFDLESSTRRLPTGSPTLARAGDRLAVELVRRLPATDSLVDRVRAMAASLDAEGQGDKSTIAAALAMSPRTLQRKLADEGCTLREILDDVRRERAESLLASGVPAVAEVAHRMGFHDPSSFRRAFKRWTGLTPAEYVERASES